MRIEIERVSGNKLSRKYWSFYFNTSTTITLNLYLDHFSSQIRRTKRCKWVSSLYYDRLDSRYPSILFNAVGLPKDVIQEAKDIFCKKIQELNIEGRE